MHIAPFNVYEKMSPNRTDTSNEKKQSTSAVGTRIIYLHDSSSLALNECKSEIITADGSYKTSVKGRNQNLSIIVVIVIPSGGKPHWGRMQHGSDDPVPVLLVLDDP